MPFVLPPIPQGQGDSGYWPRFEVAAPLPTISGVTIDAYSTGVGLAQQTARAENLQARILWIDATANIDRYNTQAKIVALVRQIKDCGFNTVVFDVKPISGQVVYKSALAPKLTEWKGKALPADFDPLPIMVRECHADGLTIFTSLNAFSEGHQLFKVGPGYARQDQQTTLYDAEPVLRAPGGATFPLTTKPDAPAPGTIGYYSSAEKLPRAAAPAFAVTVRPDGTVVDGFDRGVAALKITVPKGGWIVFGSGDAAAFLRRAATPGKPLPVDTEAEFVRADQRPGAQIPLMMNPADRQVRDDALGIVRELVAKYGVDGIVYDDRLRYAGMNADFSPNTRAEFEKRVGHPIQWPDDVFKFTLNPNLTRGIRPGRYYDLWMAFRAERISSYVAEVRHTLDAVRPGVQLGVYAGSWYGEYPALGSNWASPNVDAGFWFLTRRYQRTGYAPDLDFVITGCYYTTPTIYDAMTKGAGIGATVEAAGTMSNRLVNDQAWTYAGIELNDFKGDGRALQNALQAALASTQGVMVFDLSHDIEPLWPVFKQAFAFPARAPHQVKGLLAGVRRRRAHLDLEGARQPPVPIMVGSSGVGQ